MTSVVFVHNENKNNDFILLTMSLLPFWALNVSVALLSMQGQKFSDLIKNILICVLKMNKGLTGLEGKNFHSWVNYNFKHVGLRFSRHIPPIAGTF